MDFKVKLFMNKFQIQGVTLEAEARPDISKGFTVNSCPRPYKVDFHFGDGVAKRLATAIENCPSPLLLVDKNVFDIYFGGEEVFREIPIYVVDANEGVKQIDTVLSIVDFLEFNQATRSSMLFVVGGGILQDLGAFSGYMYKRGIPWTYVPTTLLAQGDSSVGGKTALNHKKTKNLLALFSAPRQIITDTGFLKTLSVDDLYSGAGEIFRLCVTGGAPFVEVLEEELSGFLKQDTGSIFRLIATSLSAKKAVVEYDEFELDIRRSMNYGHSFGHALEALTNYEISHGVGVTIGILVENEIALKRGMLDQKERDRLLNIGRQLIPLKSLRVFAETPLDGILELLRRDKKTEGTVLKLATLKSIGDMRFIDFELNEDGVVELQGAVKSVLKDITN